VSVARALELGRKSLSTQGWSAAFTHLSVADGEQPLQAADLEGLAMSARLMGKEAECADLLARAHRGFQDEGIAAARGSVRISRGLYLFGQWRSGASGRLVLARRAVDV
jgi:hypothetical protein